MQLLYSLRVLVEFSKTRLNFNVNFNVLNTPQHVNAFHIFVFISLFVSTAGKFYLPISLIYSA